MREIKFRGKTEQGKWVYGYYIATRNDDTTYCDYIATETTGHIRVQAETVGQYTGMKDRNGIEIYEGDTLEDTFGLTYEVRWDSDNGRFLGYRCKPRGTICYVGREPKAKIIGNIYDN